MRAGRRSSRPRAVALVALLSSLLPAGCALDPTGLGGGHGGGYPGTYGPTEGELRAGYDQGYRRGYGDAGSGRRPDYTRWRGEFDGTTVRTFASGYRDGYERAQGVQRRGDPGVGSVPGWAVGTFRGVSQRFGEGVQLTVYPDGRAQVWADDDRYGGVLQDGYLRTRKGTFEVSRARRGIRLTQMDDRRNSIRLDRID